MGIKTSQVGPVAAGSSAIQAQLTNAVAAVGGAFWDNPAGKVVLEYTLPVVQATSQNTGIVLSPTAGVWATFPWRWEVVESCPGYQLAARVYVGFITFSDIAGDPLVRFGTGIGDPGFSANGGASPAQGFNYNLSNSGSVTLLQNGTGDQPIALLSSGEIVLGVYNNTNTIAYAKGVFTVGPELVLPSNPVPPPI